MLFDYITLPNIHDLSVDEIEFESPLSQLISFLKRPSPLLRLFFCILQSPTGFHGVLMESSSPRGVLMESSWSPRGVLVESSWSPCGVLMESMESSQSPHGVSVDSMRTLH